MKADVVIVGAGFAGAATAWALARAGVRDLVVLEREAAPGAHASGRNAALRTSRGRIETPAVVDAAGAWAGTLARAAGAAPPPLAPHRRHLFESRRAPADGNAPFVWDLENGLYFRPEGRGMLLSACDEEPHPPAAPDVAPGAERDLAR